MQTFSVSVLPSGMGRIWGERVPTEAELAERAEREMQEQAERAARIAAATEHWAARLAAAQAAHKEFSTFEYLAHVLFHISPDADPQDLRLFYNFSVKCFREYVLKGYLLRDFAGDVPNLASPYGIGPVLYTYHRFRGNGRFRFPTFDIGLGEEENPDSLETWAGFAEAVLALATTAEAEANS